LIEREEIIKRHRQRPRQQEAKSIFFKELLNIDFVDILYIKKHTAYPNKYGHMKAVYEITREIGVDSTLDDVADNDKNYQVSFEEINIL
jgi:hypothetical protein